MKLHDSRQLGPLVFRDPLLLCSALYFLLYFDASGFLRLGLLAAFLHECGHILVYCALLRRFPVIEVTMTGFCMRMDAPARGLSPGRLFWLAAVGPAVNFMLAGIWALRLEQELTIRQCLLGGKSADRGIQSAARSTAGWGAAGILPVRNVACRQKV